MQTTLFISAQHWPDKLFQEVLSIILEVKWDKVQSFMDHTSDKKYIEASISL